MGKEPGWGWEAENSFEDTAQGTPPCGEAWSAVIERLYLCSRGDPADSVGYLSLLCLWQFFGFHGLRGAGH